MNTPNNTEKCFVIIGAGASGNAAAETLRQDGFTGRIVMITRESCLPYDRTQLSKNYLKNHHSNPPILRSEEFYAARDIEIMTDCHVSNVNIKEKQILCQDGILLKYDKLLLATGGTARYLNIPGAELKNIFTLRNLDDADRIKASAMKGSKVVVVGASFIGMELASTLTELELSVTVVALESVPFERTLGEEIGKMFQELHEKNGVSFELNTVVEKFEGEDKVQKVILKNGNTLKADFVLLGVGVKPSTEFLKDLKLNPDGSIPVDKYLRAADDIYAAGDIASFKDWRTDDNIRIEHWRLAREHGRIAAHNMMELKEEFRSIPFFWTSQFGVDLRYVGHVNKWDDIIFHGEPSEQKFKMTAIAELMDKNIMPTPAELQSGPIDMAQRLKEAKVRKNI